MTDSTQPHPMNGAEALIRTLTASSVDVCFTNPGTSEMHFVAALDDVPEMRGVLGLFEGVVTGAADGYGRMTRTPAATLLHLGPGLGNGLANLHNARRASTPMVNIVGDHATYHKQYDAPLESDIDSIASAVSGWFRRPMSPDAVASDTAAAITASLTPPGQIATLALPADTCWLPAPGGPTVAAAPPAAAPADDDRVAAIAALLRSDQNCTLLVGGRALTATGVETASKIAAATGAKLLMETFPARQTRGGGLPGLESVIYIGEFAQMQFADTEHLILVDTVAPVAFFAYPERPSVFTPEGCEITTFAAGPDDPVASLSALCDTLDAGGAELPPSPGRSARPEGHLDVNSLAAAIGATLPESAIVVEEAVTSGIALPGATAGAPRHDWLRLTGGSIGMGLPVAVGAAVACPDRRVLSVEADGSAMYTIQSLWTMAHENLDITVVIANNSRYAVLDMELDRVGATAGGERARELFDLAGPDLDFVGLANGMGVEATRVETAHELADHLDRAHATRGPQLIEAIIPPLQT